MVKSLRPALEAKCFLRPVTNIRSSSWLRSPPCLTKLLWRCPDMPVTAILIRAQDHVATLTGPVTAGDLVLITGQGEPREIAAQSDMPAGHKLAVRSIQPYEQILKYGEV